MSNAEAPISIADNESPEQVEVVEPIEENQFKPKKRKKTSRAWDHFEGANLPNREVRATCKHCKFVAVVKVGGPTTVLLRHIDFNCTKRSILDSTQRFIGVQKDVGNLSNITNFKYGHAKVRQAAAYMILAHEYPFAMMEHEFFNRFMWTVSPFYQKLPEQLPEMIA